MAVQRLGDVAVGTVVKLNESGDSAEFVVVQHGSPSSAYVGLDNNTLVRRKDIQSNKKYYNQLASNGDRKNDWPGCDLNKWLNNDSTGYLSLLDPDIRNVIPNIKIPYAVGNGNGTVRSGANGYECKVFILSVAECNAEEDYSSTVGTVLEYYKNASNSTRSIKFNNIASGYWTRSPQNNWSHGPSGYSYVGTRITRTGTPDGESPLSSIGCVPVFALPGSVFVLSDGTLTTNQPPTAPGSITADNVIGNQQAAITLTAATDPDGSVASYTYERQVDGGGWTVFATTSALTRTDPVDDSWTTVAYRAKATDNLGLSGPYAASQTYTVVHNLPPTAPGSIAVTGVVRGENAAITLTAATDPDGTVASYIYERQVDGGAWQQVAQVNSLTQTDTVGEDWGTVAYRACAVDNLGLAGPCITGETYTVNSGWVTIGGPAEDMGRQPRRFDFAFSVSVSGVASVDAITVSVARDGTQIYSGTPSAGAKISVPVDARLLGAGEHVIEVQASKDDYLPASRRYTFTVPAVTIPDGGYGAISQASDGKTMFYTTLAQRCIGTGGVDIQAQVDALTARVKTLEG